ncbi:MAG TPA: glycosyltransferase family 39 protein [Oculatellaceae cyanobacterium]
MTRKWVLPPKWLRFLVIVLLLLGVFFRFAHLDRKVYWHDEVYTSFRLAGYTWRELSPQVFNGKVINAKDLQKYQYPRPQKGLMDTIKSLEVDDPQHPPLYYLIARLWVQMFGYSVTLIRSLSACISLLVFPCIYWLCLELFGASLVGWMAVALVAISPFHVLYAQEAREYVLWTVTILLSSAALLQAMRLQTRLSWGIYAATLALGFYTFLFTGLVAIGHGIYVVAIAGYRWSKTVKAYLLASVAGLIVFLPWLFVLIKNWLQFRATTGWIDTIKLPQLTLIKTWGLNLMRPFMDFDWSVDEPLTSLVPPLFLILVGYAIYFVCRQTNKQVWLLILTLIGTAVLPLMLPDLIFGGVRSAASRYLIPYFLGIQLAVAYLLATQITYGRLLKQKFWQMITAVLISAGVVSCVISFQSQTSRIKVVSYNLPQVATIINQTNRPILISNNFGINVGNVFALSYLLKPTVKLQLLVDPNIPQIPEGVSDVFLLNPSDSLKQGIEKRYKSRIKPIFNDEHIWLMKLVKN